MHRAIYVILDALRRQGNATNIKFRNGVLLAKPFELLRLFLAVG